MVLAVWRLTSLVTREDGPGAIFARVRRAAGAEDEGELSSLAQGITCGWCVSVWAAMLLYGVSRLTPRLAPSLIVPLALSTGSILLEAFRPSDGH